MKKRFLFSGTGLAAAGLMMASIAAEGQTTGAETQAPDASAQAQQAATLSNTPGSKKENKVTQSKDTKKQLRNYKKTDPIATADSKLPDKQLYDKALAATKKGHFDVARLDLQTLLNTYPDSQYQMKAKLAIADSWYREGGSAALTQAEQEYKDFITFFPNAPEAAEAQMRVGDIYFRQMDKPDRDYAKAVHAQEEYRLMLQQFPDSELVPQAKQRLRDVQEVLATRESDIGSFYAGRENWAGAIARYQTVADTYPQYSHMDEVLIGLGDAYAVESKAIRAWKNMPEDVRARLLTVYDQQAADAYRKVVLEHSASPHVEDARDRLAAMNLPIPTPTPEQAAASAALENSRKSYTISDRAKLMILRRPDTVMAARDGEPPLTDPKPTLAPEVTHSFEQNFKAATNPGAVAQPTKNAATPTPAEAATADANPTPNQPANATKAPLQLQDVPAAGQGDTGSGASTMTNVPTTGGSSAPAGNSVGIEIVNPSTQSKPADTTYGLKPVGPENAAAPPPIEKPAAAPDAINDVTPGSQPAAQTPAANGKKNPKPAFDKDEESSSKHKKKKGLGKLNPF